MKLDVCRAVVTGGAGFIGSHITHTLLERGYEVTVLDNLSTGRMENIKTILHNPKLKFINGSVTDFPLLRRYFASADYVFHQAAIPSVPRSIDDPLASHEVNVTGTLNVLMAAKDNSVKKVVFASSSAVYGDSAALYKKEDMPLDPQSPYAVNKLAAEYYCQVFCAVYHLPTVCLRYFNVYGPQQDPHSEYAAVVPKFIQRVSEGESPVIFGNGEQSRDFVSVRDVVAANLIAAESDVTGLFNIGTGERTTLNQLAHTILKLMGRDDLKPVYEKQRSGDIRHSLADIAMAKSFGYAPKYCLHDGLKELTIEARRVITPEHV